MDQKSNKLKEIMKKGKPVAKPKNPPEKADCYLDGGCHESSMKYSCFGIPGSNKCASCAHKKILYGVNPYHIA